MEAGFSHALFDHALDLRLKVAGYQFDSGTPVRGWRGGADLTTRNGVFTVRYEYGSDRLNRDYNTIGGYVNVGIQLENLLRGESPTTLPEPVFKSPRNLTRMLTRKVRRNWHQPAAVVLRRTGPSGPPTPTDCSLSGFTVIAASISTGTWYPTDPPIASLGGAGSATVRLCWCGLQSTVTVKSIAFADALTDLFGAGEWVGGPPVGQMSGDTGCMTILTPLQSTGGHSPPSEIWFQFDATEAIFDRHGGISLSF